MSDAASTRARNAAGRRRGRRARGANCRRTAPHLSSTRSTSNLPSSRRLAAALWPAMPRRTASRVHWTCGSLQTPLYRRRPSRARRHHTHRRRRRRPLSNQSGTFRPAARRATSTPCSSTMGTGIVSIIIPPTHTHSLSLSLFSRCHAAPSGATLRPPVHTPVVICVSHSDAAVACSAADFGGPRGVARPAAVPPGARRARERGTWGPATAPSGSDYQPPNQPPPPHPPRPDCWTLHIL